jgi:hypothetical protein
MSSIAAKIKQALSALEAAGKALRAVDADVTEAEAVRGVLDGLRAEIAQTQSLRERANEEFAKEDAAHAHWRQVNAREQQKANSRIDALQSKLQALEKQVEERQQQHNNILAGISARAA